MDVIDLCDSDDELPSLSARLQRRDAALGAAAAGLSCQPGGSQQAPAARPPLSAVHNQAPPAAAVSPRADIKQPSQDLPRPSQPSQQAWAGSSDLLAGVEALRRRQQARAARKAAAAAAAAGADELARGGSGAAPSLPGSQQEDIAPRVQYHYQEQQRQQDEDGMIGGGWASQPSPAAAAAAAAAGGGTLRQPRRGATAARLQEQQQQQEQPWRRQSWGASQPLDPDADEDWQPPGGSQPPSQRAPAAARAAAAGAAAGGAAGGGQEGPAQKRRRRTKEEIERDKAIQAQQREDNKRRKQAASKTHALRHVRLLVDTSLVSAGGLGISMLNHINEHNKKQPAEKCINYSMSALDLAPFKALRWQRLRLEEVGGGGGASQQPQPQLQGSQASTSVLASQLEEQWEQEGHVMVCFQPQEFIDAVLHDGLASLLSLLERRAAGQRVHLMVCGLASYIMARERQLHRQDMQARALPVQHSVKVQLDDFVTGLAVRYPRLGFRDVVDEAQAAQHVQLIHTAIAMQPFKDTDATVWLRANDKTGTQAMTNLLIHHPLEDPALEAFLKSITAVPTVKPGVGHVLATRYGSLGGLMDFLLDPSKSEADKQREIAELQRVQLGEGRGMRVGPAAAKQLLELLTCADPDRKIKAEAAGDKE